VTAFRTGESGGSARTTVREDGAFGEPPRPAAGHPGGRTSASCREGVGRADVGVHSFPKGLSSFGVFTLVEAGDNRRPCRSPAPSGCRGAVDGGRGPGDGRWMTRCRARGARPLLTARWSSFHSRVAAVHRRPQTRPRGRVLTVRRLCPQGCPHAVYEACPLVSALPPGTRSVTRCYPRRPGWVRRQRRARGSTEARAPAVPARETSQVGRPAGCSGPHGGRCAG
jgi:hypothetical protein